MFKSHITYRCSAGISLNFTEGLGFDLKKGFEMGFIENFIWKPLCSISCHGLNFSLVSYHQTDRHFLNHFLDSFRIFLIHLVRLRVAVLELKW